ncbi:PREDICTED: non-structural maintenance of chromosomes element 1 homolog [Rhagoletis zephyria]|uniref:non-structural maintenance of chromosomes element 1 homolog n=1 Tax=Rhagoletis zephyria TaxID=28612 RepID=UPI0008114653|nr:PREDICTED: non-structural maintenance of chromosomes element 1 homolog [Rhagoletis zephyria]
MRDGVKKAFLQACINHGSLSTEQINDVLPPICQTYDADDALDVKKLVLEINNDLKELNQELSFIKHPLLDKEFLVFGLTFETLASKHQQHYTEADQMYFAKLVEIMAPQEDYSISWVDMYNLSSLTPTARKHLPKTRIQFLVKKWTDQGYFLEMDDKIYFGPRMLVEYASHLKTHYSDYIKDCPLCKKIVLWDIKCSSCGAKVHKECIRTFLKRNSNCPACSNVWSTALN